MQVCADICVIGAGPVGLAFASAARRRSPKSRVIILDRGDARPDDGKSVAFDPHSRAFLKELDAWAASEKPIRRAEISFAPFPKRNFPPLELRQSAESALAYVAAHEEIRAALHSQTQDNIRAGMVQDIRDAGDFAEVEFKEADGETLLMRAKLAVLACEFARMPAGFTVRDFDYGQCALALSGEIDNAQGGWDGETAYEHFSPDGLVTLVPRTGPAELGAVICAGAATGAGWGTLSDSALSARINGAFSGANFAVRMSGARRAYAPHLRRVRPHGLGRIICVGQGATTIHPIGAQGLNLALRDADALSQMLADLPQKAGGEADGWEGVAAEYSRRRRMEHFRVAAATHSLALLARRRGFPLRIAGGIFAALMSSDAAAPLRAQMVKAAVARH